MKPSTSLTILLLLGCAAATPVAAKDTALLILRGDSPAQDPCRQSSPPQVVEVEDFKLAGKATIRIDPGGGDAPRAISRDRFKDLEKVKLRDIAQIRVDEDALFVTMPVGEPMAAAPDVDPDKHSSTSMAEYLSMAVEGKAGGQKQMIPLRMIWRLFVLTETVTRSEALFRHASQEGNVSQWLFYIRQDPAYRGAEAKQRLTDSTLSCIDAAMARFRDGEMGAILDAKQYWETLESAVGATGSADERIVAIRREEQEVRSRIDSGMQLREVKQWDKALETWSEVKHYIADPAMRDFAEAYADTAQQSHDLHLANAVGELGKTAAGPDLFDIAWIAPLENAVSEADVALSRILDSAEALAQRREALIRIAMIQSRVLRAESTPRKARETLLELMETHGDDPRVKIELGEASCELSGQLFAESKTLVHDPSSKSPVINAIEPDQKATLASGRAKLVEAKSICDSPEVTVLLGQVEVAMGVYHIHRAKLAVQASRHATALLHLRAAQSYQPDNADVQPLLAASEPIVRDLTRIRAGAVVGSVDPECSQVADFLRGAIESALLDSGTATVQLLPNNEAAAAKTRLRSAEATATGGLSAVVSADIGVCILNVAAPSRQVASQYAVPNPQWPRYKREADARQQQVDACKRQAGKEHRTLCQQARSYRDAARDRLRQEPQAFARDYSYVQRDHTIEGQMRATLQIDDSLLKGTRPLGEAVATTTDSCVERQGVRPDDIHAGGGQGAPNPIAGLVSGFLGNRLGATADAPQQGLANSACPPVDRESELLRMAQKIADEAKSKSSEAVRTIADGYLALAERAPDPDDALENRILFALLSSNPTSEQRQQAVAAIQAVDPDLQVESAAR